MTTPDRYLDDTLDDFLRERVDTRSRHKPITLDAFITALHVWASEQVDYRPVVGNTTWFERLTRRGIMVSHGAGGPFVHVELREPAPAAGDTIRVILNCDLEVEAFREDAHRITVQRHGALVRLRRYHLDVLVAMVDVAPTDADQAVAAEGKSLPALAADMAGELFWWALSQRWVPAGEQGEATAKALMRLGLVRGTVELPRPGAPDGPKDGIELELSPIGVLWKGERDTHPPGMPELAGELFDDARAVQNARNQLALFVGGEVPWTNADVIQLLRARRTTRVEKALFNIADAVRATANNRREELEEELYEELDKLFPGKDPAVIKNVIEDGEAPSNQDDFVRALERAGFIYDVTPQGPTAGPRRFKPTALAGFALAIIGDTVP